MPPLTASRPSSLTSLWSGHTEMIQELNITQDMKALALETLTSGCHLIQREGLLPFKRVVFRDLRTSVALC